MNEIRISHPKKHSFNLEVVSTHFKNCVGTDGQLSLRHYMNAYHELCRFFKLTGPLFGFVARDLEHKLKSIEHHVHSTRGKHYRTVQSMIDHEIENDTTHYKSPYPSGCRMLLRLHWALEFILRFMQEIRDSNETEKASKIAWEVYADTLYHHHPWLTRKLASVAVYALPSKKQLVETMCSHNYDKVMLLLGKVLEVGQPVYNHIQDLMGKANLLQIP